MVPFQSVALKLEHASRRLNELQTAVVEFLDTHPVEFAELPGAPPGLKHPNVVPSRPVPFRIGLGCGDVLQNLRSTLDYLIYELVVVNGEKPNRKHMFPIAMDEESYRRDINNHKIRGVHPHAAVFIESLQPFLLGQPKSSALYVLDELTNLNKHRQPILTTIQGTKNHLPFNFLHVPLFVQGLDLKTGSVVDHAFKLWVAMSDEPVVNFEVCFLLTMLLEHIRLEVLPLFKPFFK
jgi:hypothetical protein